MEDTHPHEPSPWAAAQQSGELARMLEVDEEAGAPATTLAIPLYCLDTLAMKELLDCLAGKKHVGRIVGVDVIDMVRSAAAAAAAAGPAALVHPPISISIRCLLFCPWSHHSMPARLPLPAHGCTQAG